MLKIFAKLLIGLVLLLVLLVAALALSLRPHPPASTFELSSTGRSAGPETPPVLVFGATGGTGVELVKLLRERGYRVTAFVRPTSDTAPLEPLGVQTIVGDAMNMDDVRDAFAKGPYHAVISTIGCFRCDPPPDFIANKHVIDAAAQAQLHRVILITSIGAGDSRDALPWISRVLLRRILPLKEQAEQHLVESGLDYTIIRPGGLPPDTQRTGRGVLTEDRSAFGFIGRPDLARLIVDCLEDGRTIGHTFAALDPRRQSPWDSAD